MNKLNILLLVLLFGCAESPQRQLLNTAIPQSEAIQFEQAENDPLGVKIYTLENGLKVYMSVNKDEPRIQTNIAVNAGSKQDPSDATGLAHYLEHMLFKGTSRLGTMDWEKESALLQKISDTYELRRNTTDESIRATLYQQIDSLSVEASKFAIANEYDKLISSMGAKGTNAYTSLERTVYINDIPSIELEKWLKVESERFSELVLRLFHTELETVYEEFNRGQDNDRRQAYAKMMAALYKKHTYGTQTTIGTGEHLKSPSMEEIHQYFSTYYVPNNMAIILAGDFEPENAVQLIEKYFGEYKSKPVPSFTFEKEDPIVSPEVHEVYGRDKESVSIAFRLPSANHADMDKAAMMGSLLSNGQAGLIDLDLLQNQKVLGGYAYLSANRDYSSFNLGGTPREGQALEEVKDLLLSQVERIKSGDFDQWLMDAVVKDYKLSQYQSFDYNRSRTRAMTNTFIMGQDWKYASQSLARISALTKEDIVAFANKYCKSDNYITVYKRNGEPVTHKVEKPEISKLGLNRDVKSDFVKEMDLLESSRATPQFLNFEKDIVSRSLSNGLKFYAVKNEKNPTFQLNYVFDMGSRHDEKMALAMDYLTYLGTSKYSAAELNEEFYKLGCYFGVSAGLERSYVYIGGLEESMAEGLQLIEHLLKEAVSDQQAYDNMVADIVKSRKDAKLNKRSILYQGLANYAKYGKTNPQTDQMTEEELKSVNVDELVSMVKDVFSFEHYVYYYGGSSQSETAALIEKSHQVNAELKALPSMHEYEELDRQGNEVFFAHYDMVQSEIMMMAKGPLYDASLIPSQRLFNEYFGSGLSSIIFQEIRESKALAYSAYARYSVPSSPERNHFVSAYVGTQVDKMGEAIDAMLTLMNDMPRADDQFEGSRLAALKKIETSRTKSQNIFWRYLSAKKYGREGDLNQDIYSALKQSDFEDLNRFFNEQVKGKDYTFIVIGHRDKVDMDALKELGPVKELSLEELFGY
jgi:predicted Zn-dependent peptidase